MYPSRVLNTSPTQEKLCKLNSIRKTITHTLLSFIKTTVAPEVALGGKYNERCDVFSYGIIMWQIMGLEQIPYGSEKKTNHNIEFFIQHVWQGPTVRPSLEFKNPMIQKYFCPQLQDLVMKCWSHRWQHRPSMAVVEENLRKFELVLM